MEDKRQDRNSDIDLDAPRASGPRPMCPLSVVIYTRPSAAIVRHVIYKIIAVKLVIGALRTFFSRPQMTAGSVLPILECRPHSIVRVPLAEIIMQKAVIA